GLGIKRNRADQHRHCSERERKWERQSAGSKNYGFASGTGGEPLAVGADGSRAERLGSADCRVEIPGRRARARVEEGTEGGKEPSTKSGARGGDAIQPG